MVLVPFLFDDLSSSKVRPAVCLTQPIGPHRHVVVAYITSRIYNVKLPTDLVIRTTDPGFASTGLRMDSTLHLHRLMTISVSLIQRELGRLPIQMQVSVASLLRGLFDL